jgi:hypothetical protein
MFHLRLGVQEFFVMSNRLQPEKAAKGLGSLVVLGRGAPIRG